MILLLLGRVGVVTETSYVFLSELRVCSLQYLCRSSLPFTISRSTNYGLSHSFWWQYRLQTSTWPSVLTWATDINSVLSCSRTTDGDMALGGFMNHRHQHGLRREGGPEAQRDQNNYLSTGKYWMNSSRCLTWALARTGLAMLLNLNIDTIALIAIYSTAPIIFQANSNQSLLLPVPLETIWNNGRGADSLS